MPGYSRKFCYFMFFISALFFAYEFILRVSPGVMANDLLATFRIHADALGFMSSAFFYAYAAMQVPTGIILDRYSPRVVLTIACFLCALGVMVFASTTSFWTAFAGRLTIGIGASFGFVGALKVAEQWLPINRFAFISGMLATIGFSCAILSDNGLLFIIQSWGWSMAMLVLGVFGLILSLLIYIVVRDSHQLRETQDKIKSERSYKGALEILKNPFIWLNGFVGFCMYFPTNAFAELWGKSYLEHVRHFTAQEAVFSITMVFLGWAVGSPLAGWFSDYFRNHKWPFIFGAIFAAFFMIIVLYFPHLSFFMTSVFLFFFGAFSGCQVINYSYARIISSKEYSATAMAMTNMLVMFAGVFSQPIVGFLLDKNWSGLMQNHVRVYSASTYQYAFAVIPLVLLLAAVLASLLKRAEL